MCQLLGISSLENKDMASLVRVFFKRGAYNPDGWGLATYVTHETKDCGRVMDEKATIIKQPTASNLCEVAKNTYSNPIIASMAIGHIRKRTNSNIHFNNTHPFVTDVRYNKKAGTYEKELLLAHNGFVTLPIFEQNGTAITNKAKTQMLGETDSEKIMVCIKSYINNIDKYSRKNLISAIEKALEYLSPLGKVNLLFSDGDKLFVFANRKDTLYMAHNRVENYYLFCTEPIKTREDLNWVQVPLNKLHVFRQGKMIYKTEKSLLKKPVPQLEDRYKGYRWSQQSLYNHDRSFKNFDDYRVIVGGNSDSDSEDDYTDDYYEEQDSQDYYEDYYEEMMYGKLLEADKYNRLERKVENGTASYEEEEIYYYNMQAQQELGYNRRNRHYG